MPIIQEGKTFHGKIISRMRLLGYDVSPEGICFGLAHMAKQAVLSGDWKRYNQRLIELNKIKFDDFPTKYEELKNEWLELVKKKKEEALKKYKSISQEEKTLLQNDQRIKKIISYFKEAWSCY